MSDKYDLNNVNEKKQLLPQKKVSIHRYTGWLAITAMAFFLVFSSFLVNARAAGAGNDNIERNNVSPTASPTAHEETQDTTSPTQNPARQTGESEPVIKTTPEQNLALTATATFIPLKYVVQPYDTCKLIALHFDVSTESIIDLNRIPDNCSLLFVGEILFIPRPTAAISPTSQNWHVPTPTMTATPTAVNSPSPTSTTTPKN